MKQDDRKPEETVLPVSYTHLDVYKRQDLILVLALAALNQARGFVANSISSFRNQMNQIFRCV